MKLSLLVIYCPPPTLDRAARFYGAILDAEPVREHHGDGPEHWSATGADGLTIELYPAISRLHTSVRLEWRGDARGRGRTTDGQGRRVAGAYAGRCRLVGKRSLREHGGAAARGVAAPRTVPSTTAVHAAVMTSREPFVHAVTNPSVRQDIAAAVADGISPEQLAAEFQISVSTIRAYVRKWEGARRKVLALNEFEREAIIEGCRRGARRRWERQYGAEMVRQVLGES